MKLTLSEPKYFKDSVSIISDLVNEARFKITPNAVELIAMDPANVAMIVFKLLSSAFAEYELKEEISIGINLINLKQILRRAKPTDVMTLEVEDGKLNIQFKGNSTRKFSLPIIESEEKEQKVPDLTFPVQIKTTSTVLNEAIEDVDVVADSVSLIAEPGVFIIRAEGDLSKANIEIKADENTKLNYDTDETVSSKYSTEYLKKMINGSKLADNVTIAFNKDYPLKLDYKVVDKLSLSFILAPRVEEE